MPTSIPINKKNVLLVFTDVHLSYSPSTLNIYESLEKYFTVTLVAFKPDDNYSSHKITNKNVEYLNYEKELTFFLRLISLIKRTFDPSNKKANMLFNPKSKVLIERIKNFEGMVIAVDFFALWCVQKAGKYAHLLSLEIKDDDPWRRSCNLNLIQSVVIQSIDRYRYLFNEKKIKTFFVQNAPNYIKKDINSMERESTNLIYCGSATSEFGIFSCLEFLIDYPEYSLTVKGAIPSGVRNRILENFGFLISQNRLTFNDDYLNPEDLNKFLSNFFIGFVFYDFYRFISVNTFNYKSAPSGKLFQYFNAGVPVVAIDVPGLNSVKEFGAGLMIPVLNSSSIKSAIKTIEADYFTYMKGAKEASLHYDFSKSIEPYIKFLLSF